MREKLVTTGDKLKGVATRLTGRLSELAKDMRSPRGALPTGPVPGGFDSGPSYGSVWDYENVSESLGLNTTLQPGVPVPVWELARPVKKRVLGLLRKFKKE